MAASTSKASMQNLLQFMKLIGQLKRVPRTGWVYRNVEKPESVSDHMYRMAMMAFLIGDTKLNKDRCIKLALVHDMAECIVGDIAPADNISKNEKHRREEEYEYQSSPEAKLVKELDQFEMILQAYEYEDQEKKPGRMQEFFDSTKGLRTI
ncbi:HD domain-containing protein 2 [Acipenser ruthenus]|uniref:5'-deoxynucleotidase HDDC2 n=1 Tax=Acipenser ruthenus TaxID=7906 RepID=A0A444U1Q1_ACIRT|nr:HD domain-containing protein 2 [Acipenser ruthenus]